MARHPSWVIFLLCWKMEIYGFDQYLSLALWNFWLHSLVGTLKEQHSPPSFWNKSFLATVSLRAPTAEEIRNCTIICGAVSSLSHSICLLSSLFPSYFSLPSLSLFSFPLLPSSHFLSVFLCAFQLCTCWLGNQLTGLDDWAPQNEVLSAFEGPAATT